MDAVEDCLSGGSLFGGDIDQPGAVLDRTRRGQLQLNSEQLPHGLEAVIRKATDLKPRNRYSNASQLRDEVQLWLKGFATEAEHAGLKREASL